MRLARDSTFSESGYQGNVRAEREATIMMDLTARKAAASAWFETLRDDLCAAFEAVEADPPAGAPLAEMAAGRFVRKPWTRTDHTGAKGGGGVMSLLHGRVFEKAGIHTSTVHG